MLNIEKKNDDFNLTEHKLKILVIKKITFFNLFATFYNIFTSGH